MSQDYATQQPERTEVDAWKGLAVLDFGTNWCGICNAARPAIEAAMGDAPQVRHLRVEDGPGRPLGRSYRVKLWPTLVFLRDGQEVERLVRPSSREVIDQALAGFKS
jgi:thioredoxin 1